MDFEFKMNGSAEQRRQALVDLIKSSPTVGGAIPAVDVQMMTDLVIHTLDETLAHVQGHIRRAEQMFTGMEAQVVMPVLVFSLLAKQFRSAVDDMAAQSLAAILAEGDVTLAASLHDALKNRRK